MGSLDMKMFLEFPGILILIGVALLIISIIIGIIAYRKTDDDITFDIAESETKDEEEPVQEVQSVQEVTLAASEVKIEEPQEEQVENNTIEEVKEEYVELSTIEMPNNEIKEEIKEVETETNNFTFVKENNNMENEDFVLEEASETPKEEIIERPIYGGNKPQTTFEFEAKEKLIYGEKQEENNELEVEEKQVAIQDEELEVL